MLKAAKLSFFFSSLRNKVNLVRSVNVARDMMRSLEQWPDAGRYELMFATKRGLPIPYFPICHSAIALRNPHDGTFAIYGRQSPFDFSQWYRDGLVFRTKKDNEKNYLNKSFSFTAYPTGVLFNKEEINNFLNSADKLINEKQLCNMINSNCYSYSAMAMTLSINELLSKPDVASSDISSILNVMMDHPLSDNLSIGVLNNSVVVDTLLSVLSSISKRLDSLEVKSDDDKDLLEKTTALITQLSPDLSKNTSSLFK
ncbi:hypothetical protein [Legionella yabuuchiae]|uniref:hypothetical protein n=1 Tax=Legionella yabuuchiae TaxID=376727 RepID=UPI0010564DC1|nr:hypothetical protein [Legionella yabuuchiae]